ncbi:retron system putative HNH endonuclease [Vibrio harveyi]
MRAIIKTALGSNVLDRQNNQGIPQTSDEATERWGAFGKKNRVRNSLITQQKGLCGYTEFNIRDFASKTSSKNHGCHIEHIKPKALYPQETFDYHNLIICVLDDLDLKKFKSNEFIGEGGEQDDSHQKYFGGHAKGNDYNPELFISPINGSCSKHFIYLEDNGEIVVAENLTEEEQRKAEYTIDLLNLNHPYLKNQRRKKMAEVLEDIEQLDDYEQQIEMIRAEIGEDAQGHVTSFPSAILSLVAGA